MKRLDALCIAAFAAFTTVTITPAYAADQVVAAKSAQIELFAVPDDAKPGVKVAVAGLPWTIKEEKNSFYKVAVNGKDVWVDSMQVNVARASTDACPSAGQARTVQPSSVAGAPGAGANRCK
jgi:hypothetical protein